MSTNLEIPAVFKIREYGSGLEPSETVDISSVGMHLIEILPEYEYSSEASLEFIPVSYNCKLNLVSTYTGQIEDLPETVIVFQPVIVTGTNKNFSSEKYGTIDCDTVASRMKQLVESSTKPDTKIYYINKPENSMAIQDVNIFDQEFLYDKNNVANRIFISQIDFDDENFSIDIYKSMRDYQ